MPRAAVVLAVVFAAVAFALPQSPDTFEADVKITDSLIPFPMTGNHLYFDYPRGMQRMDTTAWGVTKTRIDNLVANLTFIITTPMPGASPVCRTCFMDTEVYPMQVPIFCSKTGEETVNGVDCEIWEGDFGFAPMIIHMRFDVQKVAPFSIVRSIFTDPLPHSTQMDFTGIRVGPIPEPVWNPNSTCSDPTCKVPLELVLLIDGSGSISASDFELMRQFAAKVVNQFTLSDDAVRVGVVQFSNTAVVHSALSSDKTAVQKAISSMAQLKSSTNMDAGLKSVLNMVTSSARSGVNSATIMFTDGVPDSGTNPVAVAQTLKDKDITIYTVGVGSGVDPGLLKQIATQPPETHAFLADSFDKLKELLNELLNQACKGDTCADD